MAQIQMIIMSLSAAMMTAIPVMTVHQAAMILKVQVEPKMVVMAGIMMVTEPVMQVMMMMITMVP